MTEQEYIDRKFKHVDSSLERLEERISSVKDYCRKELNFEFKWVLVSQVAFLLLNSLSAHIIK